MDIKDRARISQNNILTNSMTNAVKKNVKYLESLRTNAKTDVKPQINNLIDLYQSRKISNITTAENMILKLRTIETSTKK